MKALKIIGLVFLVLVVLVFAASFIISNEMQYEKSVTIDASKEVVWENVNSLEDLNSWSPWTDRDPEMSQEITGTDGTIGAMHSWESEMEDVGKGSQTISKLDAPNRIETALKFYEPYESEADAWLELSESGASTTVIWGFYSQMPRPFNLMMVGTDMEEMLGPDFEKGLNRLKKMSEEMQASMQVEADTTDM